MNPIIAIAIIIFFIGGIAALNKVIFSAPPPETVHTLLSPTPTVTPTSIANMTTNLTQPIGTLPPPCDNFLLHMNSTLGFRGFTLNSIAHPVGRAFCSMETGFFNAVTYLGLNPFRVAFAMMLVLVIAVCGGYVVIWSSKQFSWIFGILLIICVILLGLLILGMI